MESDEFITILALRADTVRPKQLLRAPGKSVRKRKCGMHSPASVKTRRRECQEGGYEAVELGAGFVIESGVVQLSGCDVRLLKAIFDRIDREAVIVLLAGEAFFLSGSDDLTVDEERCRRVMIKGGNSEDARCHDWVQSIGRRDWR